jgi:uncharacterized protein DUF3306
VSDDHFLSRWSRLKKASARAAAGDAPAAPGHADRIVPEAIPGAAPPAARAPNVATGGERPAALPPVESLTPESDFSPFMRAQVDETLKRRALKTLFQDPRFNVMDGLDVYIDDFSKADPLPEGWLEKMSQMAYLGDQGPEEDEVEAALAEAPPAAIPEPTEGSPLPQAPLATSVNAPSSDTSETSDVAPEVAQSRPKGRGLR